jgi:hypothetical protein
MADAIALGVIGLGAGGPGLSGGGGARDPDLPPEGGDDFEVWAGEEHPMIFALRTKGDGMEGWIGEEKPAQGVEFLVFG